MKSKITSILRKTLGALQSAGKFTAAAFGKANHAVRQFFAARAEEVKGARQMVSEARLLAKEAGESPFRAGANAFAEGVASHRSLCLSYLNHGLAVVGVMLFAVVSIGCSRLSLAVEVSCNDALVGYVESETVYQEAQDMLSDRLKNTDAYTLSIQPKFHVVVHNKDELLTAEELTNLLLEQSGNVVELATGVYIDGELFCAVTEPSAAEALLSEYVDNFRTSATSVITAKEEITYSYGYYLAEDILTIDEMNALLAESDALHAVETVELTYTEEIPYECEEVEQADLAEGQTEIITEGVNGVSEITAVVTLENGVETARETVSQTTLTEAVNQVTAVGTLQETTATATTTYTASSEAGTATYIWPVNGGYTSSHYGGSRSHKGTDIAAPSGTEIYASRSGTVIMASWYSGYGNCVMIDHGDGVVTLYGHCSAYNVTVGQTVSQGDVIAFVGTTGYSTGNHCHFEIRINGTQVNPENYIGCR